MPVPLDVSGSLHHMNSTLLSSGHWIKEQVCQYTTHDATLYSTVDLFSDQEDQSTLYFQHSPIVLNKQTKN